MIPRVRALGYLLVLLHAALGGGSALADPVGSTPAELRIPRLQRAPRLEEFLEMRPPSDLPLEAISGFIQRQPEDGRPASQRTQVYMGYDDGHLYVVFLAFDEEPDKIRAHVSRRENVFDDETVEIQIDTFNDQRRAYSFLTNPYGIQWDAIWTEGQGFDSSWDTVWQSEGRLTDEGYIVWMAIPFKSLRFPPASEANGQTWRVLFVRDIPRNNETSFWPRVSSRIEGRLNQSATLRGIDGVSPGRNLWLIPYASARTVRIEDESGAPIVDRDKSDIGLDAKWVIQDSLAFDVTANPDFSQVESDQPQVTVNERFEVFFPEKRPFFLENADYFSSPINLLFTRRIADPRVGSRLTGKVGAYSIGAMVIDDEAPGKAVDANDPLSGERALNGVIRVRRDIARQSYVGLLYTDRELEDSYNRVGGFDTRVKLDDNWDTRAQAVFSSTRTLDGERLEDPSYDVSLNRNGRKFNTHLHYVDIGREFRSALGFVPRTDVRTAHANLSYTFWREGKQLVNWRPNLFVERIVDHDGVRLDEVVSAELAWELRRRTSFGIFASDGQERLRPQDPGSPAEARDYSTGRYGLFFDSHFITPVRARVRFVESRSVNFSPAPGVTPEPANRRFVEAALTLRPFDKLRIDGTYLFTRLDDRATRNEILTNEILRVRLDYQFDPRWSVRAIVQHDRTDVEEVLSSVVPERRWNGDLLVTYLVNPWTAIYAGYNGNLRRHPIDDPLDPAVFEDSYVNDARQLFVKLSYLFRP